MNSAAMKKIAADARRELHDKIQKQAEQIGNIEQAIIEEAAYTWFIRFVALRFMEVNGHLSEKIFDISFYKTEDLFKQTIIKNCHDLHEPFPYIFSKNDGGAIEGETLFPEELLVKQTFIWKLADPTVIPEEKWRQVEIMGWLYQYFFAEKKERIVKAKKTYKADEIPYVTQLFTPDWIVRYMVQNTLGRYWVESHPEHRDLIKNWEFYVDQPNHNQDINKELAPYINKNLKVEEITCFDPAMGSGHILVYMFDVLFEIYKRCGYKDREIPRLIIENNLYGIDIDDRVHKLASFSIIMKALQYGCDFSDIASLNTLEMNLAAIQETNNMTAQDISYFAGGDAQSANASAKIKAFFDQFKNAKTYGSLLNIDSIDYDFIKDRYLKLTEKSVKTLEEKQSKEKLLQLVPTLLKQSDILQQQFDILVTNPPYIGNRYVNNDLRKHVDTYYSIGKKDLFSAFMLYGFKRVKANGLLGFMTPYVWMFISSFEPLRTYIINEKTMSSLIQLQYSGFDGATVPVCTFTLRNDKARIPGEYISLAKFNGVKNQPIKTLEAVGNPKVDYRYSVYIDIFNKIPGHPLSYWIGKQALHVMESARKLGTIAKPRVGLQTSDNQRFLRFWYEVDVRKIGFGMNNRKEAIDSKLKWFPYNKGGEFRKWYGNHFYVVNWEEDGKEIRAYNTYLNRSRDSKIGIANTEFYFKESISWSFVSSSYFGVRYSEKGFIFDTGGSSVFVEAKFIYYLTAFLCSKLAFEFLKIQNPTLNFQPGNIANLPLIIPKDANVIEQINELAKENIAIAKNEWNCFETSAEFAIHPLLRFKRSQNTIKEAFETWNEYLLQQFKAMKWNEEQLNQIFIDIYGVGDEFTADVPDENVTLRRAHKEREIKSLISYAVGCMFGRYSLDEEGLVFGGGTFDYSRYPTFHATEHNILTIGLDKYFENDIVTRFIEFIKITFAEETLFENLEYIAAALGRKKGETAKAAIRRYFLQDFYKDHLQIYKKRPIYWLFSSGKQKACNCLIYIHRYDQETLLRIYTDYVQRLLVHIAEAKESLLTNIEDKSKKELQALEKKLQELKKYEQIIEPVVNEQIELDLDDGIAVNYQKFTELLAPIQ